MRANQIKRVLLLTLLFFGCAPGATPLPDDVQLEFDVDSRNSRAVLVNGKTNLPEGTQLMVSIKDAPTDGQTGTGQSKCVVGKGGTFRAGPFGKGRRNGPFAGRFIADVTVPHAFTQTPEVQAIIGSNGQNLRGPLISKQESTFGPIVEVKKEFTVGGPRGIAHQEREIAADTEKCKECFRELQQLGDEVKTATAGSMTSAEKDQFTKRLRVLRPRIDSILRYSVQMPLKDASDDVRSMVQFGSHVVGIFNHAQLFDHSMGHAKESVDELK